MGLEHPSLAEGPASGTTVGQRVARDGPLDLRGALRLGVELAGALTCLHEGGRLAPALSPASVALGPDGRPLFFVDAGPPDAQGGWVSFERSSGRERPASDLYQLGALLFFALTGREPRAAGLPLELRAEALAPIPEELRPTLARLLEPRWDRRHATAREAGQELEALSSGSLMPRQRRRLKAIAAALVCGLALPAIAYRSWLRGPAPPPSAGPASSAPFSRQGLSSNVSWTLVHALGLEIVGLQSLPQGLWIFTQYSAVWLPEDRAQAGTRLQHPGASYTAGVGTGSEVFLGGARGQAYRARVDGASSQAPPSLGSGAQVGALAWRDGTLYATSAGSVWSWREGEPAWTRLPIVSGANVATLLLTHDGVLYAGGIGGLWRREGRAWRAVWTSAAVADEILSLAELGGRIHIGTADGFRTLIADEVAWHELRGHRVMAFAAGAQGRLWVGTGGGVFERDREGGTLRRVPFLRLRYMNYQPSVSSLAVDSSGLIWLGIRGSGAFAGWEATVYDATP